MIGEHQNFDVKYSEVFEEKMLVVTRKKKSPKHKENTVI
jgi:hypothetical protein